MILNIVAVLFLLTLIVTGAKLMKKVPTPTDFDRYVGEFGMIWDRQVLDPRMEGPYITTDEKGQFVIHTGIGIKDGEYVRVER